MTQANNVLEFPKSNQNNISKDESLNEYFTKNKKEYIDHVVEHYSTQLINKLGMHGFEIYEKEFIKRYAFTVEAFRATLYLSLDIHHPFKNPIEELVNSFDDIEPSDEFPEDDGPNSA